MQAHMRSRCRLCGAHEVSTDEVLDAGVLRLAECERCGHLWTERPLLLAARPPEWAEGEVAEAA